MLVLPVPPLPLITLMACCNTTGCSLCAVRVLLAFTVHAAYRLGAGGQYSACEPEWILTASWALAAY
jgi:hypothetical protein